MDQIWDKNEALQTVAGDQALLAELCTIFLEEYPRELEHLREAVARRYAKDVCNTAHAIKGEVSCLAAKRATELAQQLEDMGHADDLSGESDSTLVSLEGELARLRSVLEGVVTQSQ